MLPLPQLKLPPAFGVMLIYVNTLIIKNDALCNPDAELTIISLSSNFNQKRLDALVRWRGGVCVCEGETREASPPKK